MSLNTQVADNTLAIQSLSDNAKSISQLPAKTTALDSADVIALQDTSGTFRVTLSQIETFIGSGGATSFLGLTDTPANYTLKQGQNVKVSTSGNSLEFTPDYFDFAASDESSDLAVQRVFSMTCNRPYTAIYGIAFSVTTAPTGSGIIIDVKKNNLTIMGTLATIDAGELTTYASATQPVNYVNSSFNIGDILSVHVTQIGSTNPGSGLKGTITYNIPFAI
tara:strand:+ start:6196 stop:6858 length:663 start_codon:yes stop_codon:yes gene_type:complete